MTYYRTRYLDHAAGRFITRDSIGIWGGEDNWGNAYAYVGDDPTTEDDPSGEAAGDGISGVQVGLKKKPGGQLYASANYSSAKSNTELYPASLNTTRSNIKDKGQLYAASLNTSRSNIKDKHLYASANYNSAKSNTELYAASINTSRSNLKNSPSLAAAGDGRPGSKPGIVYHSSNGWTCICIENCTDAKNWACFPPKKAD